MVLPGIASAQWYAGVYLGANTTQPADVTVRANGLDVTYQNVDFEAKSFTSPQYYGYRIGRFLSESRRIGLEIEFIHLKVIARPEALDSRVTRYQMTHGLNFLVANVSHRLPLGQSTSGDGKVALMTRAGLGITLPHAETTVLGQAREQYEYAGLGAHGAVGVSVRLKGRLSMVSEYKVTWAKPKITTALNGTGQTTTLSHHIAVGFAFGLSR